MPNTDKYEYRVITKDARGREEVTVCESKIAARRLQFTKAKTWKYKTVFAQWRLKPVWNHIKFIRVSSLKNGAKT